MAVHDDDDAQDEDEEAEDQASLTQPSTTPLDSRPDDPVVPSAELPEPAEDEALDPIPADGAALPDPSQTGAQDDRLPDHLTGGDGGPGAASGGDQSGTDQAKAPNGSTVSPAPFDQVAEDGGAKDASEDPAHHGADAATDHPIDPDSPDGDDPAQDEGRDVMLGPEDGDVRLEGFTPGLDVLDIEVPDREVTAFRSLDPETGDAQLRLFDGEREQVITFAGLGSVPVEDVFLLMTDPETGDAISTALGEYLFNEQAALDPIKPEEPSIISPDEEEETSPGLDPLTPDAPSVITPWSAQNSETLVEPSDETIAAAQVEATAAAGGAKAGLRA